MESLRFRAHPSSLASRSCTCPPLRWAAQRHLTRMIGAGGGAAGVEWQRWSGRGRRLSGRGRVAKVSHHRQSRRSRRPRPLATHAGAPVATPVGLFFGPLPPSRAPSLWMPSDLSREGEGRRSGRARAGGNGWDWRAWVGLAGVETTKNGGGMKRR
jgi:hypothetical protein